MLPAAAHVRASSTPATTRAVTRPRLRLGSAVCTAASRAVLLPSASVEAAIAAASANGLASPSCASEQQLALARRLRDNWYHTAADVAAMTQEEVQMLGLPVRVWAQLLALLAAAAPPKQPAPEQLQQGAEQALAASVATLSASVGQSSGLAGAFLEPLPADIMQRRLPAIPHGRGVVAARAVAVRPRPQVQQPYCLTAAETSAPLAQELQELQRFCCGTFFGQLAPTLRPVSYLGYERELKLMLGFAHRQRGVPLAQLSLATLLPSSERQGVSLLLDYQAWRARERGVAPRSAVQPIKAAIVAARFLFHAQAKPTTQPPYRDVPVVAELAGVLRVALKAAAGAPLVADESLKWLQWDEFQGLVRALRAECAGLTASGRLRPRREVAASLQRYLVVAILSVVPDRQRTLRELEVGRTLLQRDGTWLIKHGPGDYKTGKQYGDRPPLVIAPFVYPELEAFIRTWRAELQPKTSRLFVGPRTGTELTGDGLYSMFKKAALRLTGKATHPHLVRDMIVTHLRDQGTDPSDMDALALLMGHSVKEQQMTYDRRTKQQKVKPAVQLLGELAAGL